MKRIISIQKNVAVKFMLLVFVAISFIACNKENLIIYEAGDIPGLGGTPGDLTGNPFELPSNVELIGDITGSGNYSGYWNHSTGGQEIHYYGSGRGYVDLLLKLRNARSNPVTVTFPAATILVSKTGRCQNGVLMQKVTVTIPANSEYHLCLSFYCGNAHKNAAGNSDVYVFSVVSNAKPLIDLCNKLKNKKINIEKFSNTSTSDYNIYSGQGPKLQNIIWSVTDGEGISESDIEYINSLPNN